MSNGSPPKNGIHSGRAARYYQKAKEFFGDTNRVIALGTIGLGLIGLWALWIAHDTEIRQLRAYVAIEPMYIQNFKPDSRPSAGVKATVLGQTPAYDFELITHIATLPYPLQSDIRETPSPKADVIARTVLAPGQHASNAPTLAYAPTSQQFKLLSANGPYRLYVWGTVNYFDAFKRHRRSRFCYSYPASDGLQVGDAPVSELCPVGNCADDQCSWF